MTIESLTVPDLGGAEQVEVIEILVVAGDSVMAEDGLIVLETDKATMEIPSPLAGTISSISISVGDKLSEGDQYGEIETSSTGPIAEPESETVEKPSAVVAQQSEQAAEISVDSDDATQESKAVASQLEIITVPDLGGSENVEVIELLVNVGEDVDSEQSVLTLETDKASMEIPAGKSGRVEKILLTLGDKVSVGDPMLELMVTAQTTAPSTGSEANDKKEKNIEKENITTEAAQKPNVPVTPEKSSPSSNHSISSSTTIHAGPAVRKLAREFGVDLALVKGTGSRGRITKDNVQDHVKSALQNPTVVGSGIPKVAEIDFSKFGETETSPLNKIKLATAKNMTAAWLNAPQVTQFDQADITELEAFRKNVNAAPDTQQKLSAVPFVMKTIAVAMKEFPQFSASLSADGQSLIYKKYIHIGVAVDTPNGLLVPVIRDVDKKSITQIAQDLNDKAQKARAGKLGLADMQGGCFSVSSLGGIGGTAFTPIVNAPEVAILGLSRAEVKPMWNGSDFVPKLMLPLSLSYDHRVIDGAEAARFSQRLASLLGDIRRLVL